MSLKFHDIPYLSLVKDVLANGRISGNRTAEPARSVFARQMRFDVSHGSIPMLTSKKMFTRGTIVELLDLFVAGEQNIRPIQDQKVHIWDEWASPEGHLNKVYGAQWRKWENPNWKRQVTEVAIRCGGLDAAFEPPTPVTPEIIITDDLTDKTFKNASGDTFKVLTKVKPNPGDKNSSYVVQFTETNSIVTAMRPNVRQGQVKDPYQKTVFNQGCIGVYGEYHHYTKEAYNLWYNMMRRCYDPSHAMYYIYGGQGVYVEQQWRCFANFLRDIHSLVNFTTWMEAPNKYCLDKDYYGSKVYGKNTCVFLPNEYNQALPKTNGCKYIATHLATGKTYEFTFLKWFAKQHNFKHPQAISHALHHSPTHVSKGWKFQHVEPRPGYVFRQKLVVDQLQQLVDTLKTKPHDRRMIVSAWNVADLDEMALPPCHYLFQCYSEEMTLEERIEWAGMHRAFYVNQMDIATQADEQRYMNILDEIKVPRYALSLMLNQRSADVGLGVPFNIVQYTMLLHMLCEVVGMAPKEFIWSGGVVHIYENHVKQLSEQLNNPIHPSPVLKFKRSINSIDDFKLEDFEIDGYTPGPKIDMDVAV